MFEKIKELRNHKDSWFSFGHANLICTLHTRNYGAQSLLQVGGNWVSEVINIWGAFDIYGQDFKILGRLSKNVTLYVISKKA